MCQFEPCRTSRRQRITPPGTKADACAEYLRREIDKWARVINRNNIKLD